MEIHLPTRPNIPLELMKYRAGGVLVLIALVVSILLLAYLLRRVAKVIIKYRRHLHAQFQLLYNLKRKYKNDLQQLEGREFVVALLSYLERYGAKKDYSSLEDLLSQLWIEQQKIEQILLLYYSKRGDEGAIAAYLKMQLDAI